MVDLYDTCSCGQPVDVTFEIYKYKFWFSFLGNLGTTRMCGVIITACFVLIASLALVHIYCQTVVVNKMCSLNSEQLTYIFNTYLVTSRLSRVAFAMGVA